jgi:hypothetical protein
VGQDLSGTTLLSGVTVARLARNGRFRKRDGEASSVSIGDAFARLDGSGRLNRFRYDTPSWNGLALKGSVGLDEVVEDRRAPWDVAVAYGHEGGMLRVRAKTAFVRRADHTSQLIGSVSALHRQTGLNLTLAAGGREREGGDSPLYRYAKVGWRGRTAFAAPTAFSVDVYAGENIATGGSESHSFGLGMVQPLGGRRTAFYAGLRWHEYDDAKADYREGLSFLTGARFSF